MGQWLDQPEYVALRHETRDAVADKFWSVIQVGLEEVAKGLRDPDAALRDKSVALGVLYDKHALLTGGATNRSESRDITGTLSDAELVDTIRVIDGGRSGASEPSSGEAAG